MLSLHVHKFARGFTLVEVMIAIVILGVVMAIALPMYQTWIRNTQIRTAAESIQNGLQLARATAVQRNTQTELVFTANVPTTTAVTAAITGTNWVVRTTDTTLPEAFVQGRALTEGSRNVQITKPQSTYAFTALGRLNPQPAGALSILVTDSALSTTDVRSLNIVIQVGGGIRMCDPKLTSPDPQAC